MWWAAAAMIALQLLFCYAPIGLGEWLLTAALAGVIFLLTEAAKAITRARTRTETTVRQAART